MEKDEAIPNKRTLKKTNKLENLRKLILEEDDKRIESLQDTIVKRYNKRYKDDNISQATVSRLLKNKDTFKEKDGYIYLVDYSKKIDSVRELFIENDVNVNILEHYRLRTKGNPEDVLAVLKKKYRGQIIDARISNKSIFLTISYGLDHSNYNPKDVNGNDIGSVLELLDYEREVNEKK